MEPRPLVTPSWFKQRQCKLESVGENLFRISGPNLPETFLGLRRRGDGLLQGYLCAQKDGPDEVVTERDFDSEYNAWEAAFELYRQKIII